MAEFERTLISSTLEQTRGDRRAAARMLGLSLATLYRRIERLGLKSREVRDDGAPDTGTNTPHTGGSR